MMEELESFKLLVEGSDEEHVMKKLLEKNGLQKNFAIKPKGGYEKLRKSIPVELKVAGLKVMGMVADANNCVSDRWKSIADPLKKSGFEIPAKIPKKSNTFWSCNGITVGIWFMPNNRDQGELEDFILKMIDEDDPVLPLAKQYIDEIPPEYRKFKVAKSERAYLYAWLASRKEPKPIGTAIVAGDIDHTKPISKSFLSWLRSLFTL